MPASDLNGTTVKSHKRSLAPEEILTTDEAAEMLGVSPRTVRGYVTRGLLKAIDSGANKLLVSLHDVAAMAGTLVEGFDFSRVARTAVRALVSAARAERRVERLEIILGVDSFSLGTSEEEVVSFHRQCIDLLADYIEDMPAPDVLDWAYHLSAVTEEYLEAVELHTGDREPWQAYMDAAQKLYDCAPRRDFNYRKDLEVAYGYVGAARRHLRQVAYFYIRRKFGERVAGKACPEMSICPRDEKIFRLIFMMKQK